MSRSRRRPRAPTASTSPCSTPSGQPIVPVEPPEVELTQEALDIGPLEPPVLLSPGPGEYQVITDITQPGDWTITVRVRVSDFVSVAGEGTVPISG